MVGNGPAPARLENLVPRAEPFCRLATQRPLAVRTDLPLGQRPFQPAKARVCPCPPAPIHFCNCAFVSSGMPFSSLSLGNSCLVYRPVLSYKSPLTGSLSLVTSPPWLWVLPVWGVTCQRSSMLCSGQGDTGPAFALICSSPTFQSQQRRKLMLREVEQLHSWRVGESGREPILVSFQSPHSYFPSHWEKHEVDCWVPNSYHSRTLPPRSQGGWWKEYSSLSLASYRL